MNKFLISLMAVLVLFSCEKEKTERTAPQLPPAETMALSFDEFISIEKSATLSKTNWLYSTATVGVWHTIIGTTFAIPVAAFKAAFNHNPIREGDLTWQWQYTVDGFTSQYTARLVGRLVMSSVVWEMYISKEGVDSFEEFLWFEGTSEIDGNNGQWILYHSADFPEETVQIDWKKEADEVGEIKYTYIRELNNLQQTDVFNGSTLTYGLQDSEMDIYVNIHAFDINAEAFFDTYIEWNKTIYNGHVKAEHFYGDDEWHCWDSSGDDVVCE